MTNKYVDEREENTVRILTLNRPERRNAFSIALYRELTDSLRRADHDKSVHAVVLTGAGTVFSAGTDLDELAAIAGGKSPEGAATAFPGLLDALGEIDVPLVAAVNGPGIGLGATMLVYFDLVFMADSARLQVPFAAMGVPPEAGSSTAFPMRMGWQRAARMLLSSAWVSAEEAVASGLATGVIPSDRLLVEAVAAAQDIAVHDRQSTRAVKALMRAGERDAIHAARVREEEAWRRLFGPTPS